MFASARLGHASTRLGLRSFSSAASPKTTSRIPSSLTPRQSLPSNGLILKNARSKFAPSLIRNATQSRGIVAETITTAVVIHGKAVGAGAACLGLAGMQRNTASFCNVCANPDLPAGAGVGIGSVFSSLITGVARNPALRGRSTVRMDCSKANDDCLQPNSSNTQFSVSLLQKRKACSAL